MSGLSVLRPFCFSVALCATASASLDQPWQKLSDPTAADAAVYFAEPPPECSAQFTWGWGGLIDRDAIQRDLDGMKALGVYAAIIEPKAGMRDPYLSPGYFELVRIAVEEAKKRNMRLWIMDDGDYPSGIAGGKFTMERPDLRMQALAPSEKIPVPEGISIKRTLDDDVIGALATNKASHESRVLNIDSRHLEWAAPVGEWELVLLKRVFRSGPTRSANSPNGAKDYTHSLMDYLSPEAGQAFREWMFESYAKVIGDEFGKTVLGFRGDEPAFNFNPWTPRLFEEFQKRKGYDLRPYLANFGPGAAARNPALTDEERRAYADYCDVWSDLFRDNYFNMEAAWCAAHGLEMQVHIEHEEILSQLALADGDYFKCFREIQVPGIDIIWHQIWMDNLADFPKLASSAAHLYGHPRAMCEAFAAYQPPPNLKEAKWLLDFLMVHGINRIEYMYWPSVASRANRPSAAGTNSTATPSNAASSPASAPGSGARPENTNRFAVRYFRDPGFPAVAAYANRVCYLLGEGRPAAKIGLYVPSSSFWLATAADGKEINQNFLAIARQLIEHQYDFDFVDEQALSSVLTAKGGTLVNLSGQSYETIIVPPCAAISEVALSRLRALAAAGGKVVFMGSAPGVMVGQNFLTAKDPADISWAQKKENGRELTPDVFASLPRSDFALNEPNKAVSYIHRRLRDAEVYFIFNSGDQAISTRALLAGKGTAQMWDAETGKIQTLATAKAERGGISVPLKLAPWATAIITIERIPGHAN